MLRSLFLFIRVRHVQRTDKVRQLHVGDRKFVFQCLRIKRVQSSFRVVYDLKTQVQPVNLPSYSFLC